ncbi:MAG: hypothetical protein Q7S42_06245, partial [Candidatus Omnitrophota bacterium]|nr:hypothetical protein [Candidatus Omnitrophota bacterium]
AALFVLGIGLVVVFVLGIGSNFFGAVGVGLFFLWIILSLKRWLLVRQMPIEEEVIKFFTREGNQLLAKRINVLLKKAETLESAAKDLDRYAEERDRAARGLNTKADEEREPKDWWGGSNRYSAYRAKQEAERSRRKAGSLRKQAKSLREEASFRLSRPLERAQSRQEIAELLGRIRSEELQRLDRSRKYILVASIVCIFTSLIISRFLGASFVFFNSQFESILSWLK